MTIFLIVTYYFILACFYYSYSLDWKMKTGKPFMVSVPSYEQNNPRLREILDGYHGTIRTFFLVMAGAGLLFLVPQISWSIRFAALLLSILPCFFIPSFFGRKARASVMALKKAEYWPRADSGSYHVDLSLDRKTVNKAMAPLYAFLASLLPHAAAVWTCFTAQAASYALIGASVCSLLLLSAGYFYIKHMANRTFCDDSERNLALNQYRKYSFSWILVFMTASDGFLYLALLPGLTGQAAGSFAAVLTSLCAAAACIVLVFIRLTDYRNTKEKLLAGASRFLYDEDDYWYIGLWGLCYNNPYDPALFKANNSGGINMCVNKARPGSRVFWTACLGLPALLMIWLLGYPWYLDATHSLVDVQLADGLIRVESSLYRKSIPVDTIEDASLVWELGNGSKSFGTSTPNYGTGSFRYDLYGSVKAYAAWKHPPFLLLHTAEGTYLINDDDPAGTEALYEQLNSLLGPLPRGGNAREVFE